MLLTNLRANVQLISQLQDCVDELTNLRSKSEVTIGCLNQRVEDLVLNKSSLEEETGYLEEEILLLSEHINRIKETRNHAFSFITKNSSYC